MPGMAAHGWRGHGHNPGPNRFLTRDAYTGVLDDLNLGTNPHTGKRYAFAGGNPITGVELDGHLTGAQCGPDGIRCGMTDMGSSAGYTPVVAAAPAPEEPMKKLSYGTATALVLLLLALRTSRRTAPPPPPVGTSPKAVQLAGSVSGQGR